MFGFSKSPAPNEIVPGLSVTPTTAPALMKDFMNLLCDPNSDMDATASAFRNIYTQRFFDLNSTGSIVQEKIASSSLSPEFIQERLAILVDREQQSIREFIDKYSFAASYGHDISIMIRDHALKQLPNVDFYASEISKMMGYDPFSNLSAPKNFDFRK